MTSTFSPPPGISEARGEESEVEHLPISSATNFNIVIPASMSMDSHSQNRDGEDDEEDAEGILDSEQQLGDLETVTMDDVASMSSKISVASTSDAMTTEGDENENEMTLTSSASPKSISDQPSKRKRKRDAKDIIRLIPTSMTTPTTPEGENTEELLLLAASKSSNESSLLTSPEPSHHDEAMSSEDYPKPDVVTKLPTANFLQTSFSISALAESTTPTSPEPSLTPSSPRSLSPRSMAALPFPPGWHNKKGKP